MQRLRHYLPDMKLRLINDFLTEKPSTFANQKLNEILVLENIRFYSEEKQYDKGFAPKLASRADVYINDAFAMCQNKSVNCWCPQFLANYCGLQLRKEIAMISKAITKPKALWLLL